MSGEVRVWDDSAQKIVSVEWPDLEEELRKLREVLERVFNSMKQIDGYPLDTMTVKVALKGSIWVVSAEGAITLTYARPKAT